MTAVKARAGDEADIYDRIYRSLEASKGALNRDYVLGQAKSFQRYQQIRSGIAQAIDALKRDDESGVEDAAAALTKATKAQLDLFDPGVEFSDHSRLLSFLDSEHESLPCGIPELDRVGLGPARKRIHVLAALSGHGKSWWLVHLAKTAWRHNLKVVYVTLELSEAEVSQRLVQSMLALTKRKDELTRQQFERDELGRLVRLDTVDIGTRPALADSNIRGHIKRKLGSLKRRPPLFIKEFPTGGAKVRDVEAYLDSLEASKGFVPDLLIVDYMDSFASDAKTYRHDLRHNAEALRGIGIKRNIAVATATQSNRQGYGAKVLKAKHVSEDIGKVQTADVYITLNRTDAEKRLGLARLYVDKARTDQDKFTVLISQSYATGQFVLDSVRMVSAYWSMLPEDEDDEDAEPRFKRGKRDEEDD